MAVGHGVVAWDLVGELHGAWQLDLDGSNQGLLEVDAPLWLVGGGGDLLDLPGFPLSLHRRLQEHLESPRGWRGGGGTQCPPVERLGNTQLSGDVKPVEGGQRRKWPTSESNFEDPRTWHASAGQLVLLGQENEMVRNNFF